MKYDEIDEFTEVSQSEAIDELSQHGIGEIWILAFGELYSVERDEIIVSQLENGNYSALEILNWLGY